MNKTCYLDIEQASQVLAELGLDINERQIKRAAEKDNNGKRKLPFFIDPIDRKLKIEKSTLLNIYFSHQKLAENCAIFPNID